MFETSSVILVLWWRRWSCCESPRGTPRAEFKEKWRAAFFKLKSIAIGNLSTRAKRILKVLQRCHSLVCALWLTCTHVHTYTDEFSTYKRKTSHFKDHTLFIHSLLNVLSLIFLSSLLPMGYLGTNGFKSMDL